MLSGYCTQQIRRTPGVELLIRTFCCLSLRIRLHCNAPFDPNNAHELMMNTSVQFFDKQFSGQLQCGQHQLNPFESMTLPYLSGQVLDFGCGLGNLAVAAAERGCRVLALDAAPTAIAHLNQTAGARRLPITAVEADLRSYRIDSTYDCVVSIGLLMFLDPKAARAQLSQLLQCVRRGGLASINVLITGTTYMDMFDATSYYLFEPDELHRAFAEWDIVIESVDEFEAPRNTVKRFATLIARRSR